jgi:hypothetical protein
MRSRSTRVNAAVDETLRAADLGRRSDGRAPAEIATGPTATTGSGIPADEPGWRLLVPLVRLLARQAAAEAVRRSVHGDLAAAVLRLNLAAAVLRLNPHARRGAPHGHPGRLHVGPVTIPTGCRIDQGARA